MISDGVTVQAPTGFGGAPWALAIVPLPISNRKAAVATAAGR
jgi:hypothetical protein